MRRFQVLAVLGGLMLGFGGSLLRAQGPPPPPPPDQTLTPQQLENLAAPVALYPDPLLSQVLVASTYPLEVVQAYQFLQRNPGLTGTALTDAAQQQNWDPSIQALVVLPDVLKRLNDDVTWTTSLGNAFLAQQSDVMNAVQQLRQQAQQAGKLQSTPQETVTAATDDGTPYIDIEPADPDVMYVPAYDPAWFWGPPLYYPYPSWYWPPRPVGGLFLNFGPGVHIGLFFGGGWSGWGGWGWHFGWGAHTVMVNNVFIHRYNFNGAHLTQLHGATAWQHDSFHRQGVPYARPEVAQHYNTPVRENLRPGATQQARGVPQNNEKIGNRTVPQNNNSRGVFGGMENGHAATIHSDHGYSSLGPSRSGGGGGGGHAAPPSGGGRRGK